MSPRAACLLDLYGFASVYDYTGGKADWMGFGLPVEGSEGPFAGQEAAPMLTLRWDYTVEDARIRLGDSWPEEHLSHPGDELGHAHDHDHHDHDHDDHGHDHGEAGHGHPAHAGGRIDVNRIVAVVLGPGDLVIGAIDDHALVHPPAATSILEVMSPVPPTVRPSVTIAGLKASSDQRAVVSTPDGRLLGELDLTALDSDADADAGAGADEAYASAVAEITAAVQARFGDEDPSPEALRGFLRERLISEGRSPEEADRFLDEMEDEAEDPPETGESD